MGVGTSVGQVRVNGAMERRDVLYDLLHSYEDGGELAVLTGRSDNKHNINLKYLICCLCQFPVPFAVEERSGVITVIDDLTKFNRPMYDFEAVASQENTNVTLATNATVHVVDVRDDRGVLLKYELHIQSTTYSYIDVAEYIYSPSVSEVRTLRWYST